MPYVNSDNSGPWYSSTGSVIAIMLVRRDKTLNSFYQQVTNSVLKDVIIKKMTEDTDWRTDWSLKESGVFIIGVTNVVSQIVWHCPVNKILLKGL